MVVEPKPEDVVLCTYPDTLDGWLAAWVVRKVAHIDKFPVEFAVAPVVGIDAIDGRNWIRFLPDTDRDLRGAKSTLAFSRGLDSTGRPIPYAKWKRTFPFGIESMTESNEVGLRAIPNAGLALSAWDFFRAAKVGERRPRLIDAVSDAVTGAYKFSETREIVACAETYPWDFRTLDHLVEAVDNTRRREFVVAGGQAVLRYIAKRPAE